MGIFLLAWVTSIGTVLAGAMFALWLRAKLTIHEAIPESRSNLTEVRMDAIEAEIQMLSVDRATIDAIVEREQRRAAVRQRVEEMRGPQS